MNVFPPDMPHYEVRFWLEEAEPAIRAEERLRAGEVEPADVYKTALLASGDEQEASEWVRAYAEADVRSALRRHHGT